MNDDYSYLQTTLRTKPSGDFGFSGRPGAGLGATFNQNPDAGPSRRPPNPGGGGSNPPVPPTDQYVTFTGSGGRVIGEI